MLISRKMNKSIVVYSHNGIQNINPNKQNVSTHDNINVSHKQNTEPKNPGQKKKIIYIPLIQNSIMAKLIYTVRLQRSILPLDVTY